MIGHRNLVVLMLALLVVEEREGLQGIETIPAQERVYQAPASYDRRMPPPPRTSPQSYREEITAVTDRRYGVPQSRS